MEIKVKLELEKTLDKLKENIEFVKTINDIKDMKDQNLFYHTINDKFKELNSSFEEQIKPAKEQIKLLKDTIKEIELTQKDVVLKLLKESRDFDSLKGYYGYIAPKREQKVDTDWLEKKINSEIMDFIFRLYNRKDIDKGIKHFIDVAIPTITWKLNKLTIEDLEIFKNHLVTKSKPESISILSTAYKKNCIK